MTKEKTNRNEVVGMFLTYCRKTLVNARTDVLRERKRRRNREVLLLPGRCSITSTTSWTDSAPGSTPTRMASGITASTSR